MSDKNFKVKNGLDANGAVTITQPNTSTVPLTILANTLATGSNLLEVKRPDGTVRLSIGNDGALGAQNLSALNVRFYSANSGSWPLVLRGQASQTADLQQWRDVSENVLASVSASGSITAVDLTLSGNLTVNGTTTNLNSTNLIIEDKNIIIADVATPTDTTADGAGITIKGATDKTFNWVQSTGSFTSSEPLIVNTNSITRPSLIVKAIASQTSAVQEWQNSSGSSLANIDSSGYFRGPLVEVRPTNPGLYGIAIAANASQSGDLFQITDASNNAYTGVSATGKLVTGNTTNTSRFLQITNAALGQLTVYSPTTTTTGIVVKGIASQTANLQEWQDNNGNVAAKVAADYSISSYAGGFFGTITGNGQVSGTNYLAVRGWNAAHIPFAIKGYTAQTADLTRWVNDAGTTIASVSASGGLTTSADASIHGITLGWAGGQDYHNLAFGYNALQNNTTGTINMGFGYRALQSNTTGWNNLAMGSDALVANTTGQQNTAVGAQALYSNTSGGENVAIGNWALLNGNGGWNTAVGASSMNQNSGSGFNTAVGRASLYSISTGSHNTAIGQQAAGGTTTGNSNSILGSEALISLTTGNNNIAIGRDAGRSVITGSGNIFLGYQAGYSETGSNKLYIHNSNTSTPLIGGDFSVKTLSIAGNTTITSQTASTAGLIVYGASSQSVDLQQWKNSGGTTLARINQYGDLYVTGGRIFRGSNDFGANLNITNESNIIGITIKGHTSQTANLQEWQNSAGTVLAKVKPDGGIYVQGGSAQSSIDGANGQLSIRVGGELAASATIGSGYAAGVALIAKGVASQTGDLQQWRNSAGTVLASISSTGKLTSAVDASINGMTIGLGSGSISSNTAIGISALGSNTTGSGNTALGAYAGTTNTSTVDNTYIGKNAGYYSYGNYNVFIGSGAAFNGGSGSNNTYIGTWTGTGNNYSGCVFIGYNAGQNTTGNNQLVIANTSTATPLIGGDFSAKTLTVAGNATITSQATGTIGLIVKGAASQTADLQQWQNSAGSVTAKVSSSGAISSSAGGFFGSTDAAASGVNYLAVRGWAADHVPFAVKGFTAQTGDLTRWINDAGTVLTSISSTGKLTSAVDASINGVVIGMGAGSASSNTSVGLNSLVSNTTGTYNTAFGNQSLQLNTSGTQNTAFGQNALYNNRTGWYNTAFGQGALQNNNYAYSNTAIGTAAMINNISGSGNTAVGIQSLLLNSSGGNNVGIGQNAGFSNSTGSGNIFLGSEAGYYETGSNKLYIANTNTTTPLIGGDFSAKTLTFAGNATITSQATGTVGLIIKGASSQTADLQQWQDSAGTVLSGIGPNGRIFAQGKTGNTDDLLYLRRADNSVYMYVDKDATLRGNFSIRLNQETPIDTQAFIWSGTASRSALGVSGTGSTNPTFYVKAVASQTSNLTEWQNSAGSVLANVDSAGFVNGSAYRQIGGNSNQFGNGAVISGVLTAFGPGGNAAIVPVVIKGAASQTANLQEWQNSSGQARVYVDGYGGLYSKTVAQFGNDYNQPGTSLTVYTKDAAGIPLVSKGWTSQTADLQQWQNSSGTALSKVDAYGNYVSSGLIVTPSLATFTNATVQIKGTSNSNAILALQPYSGSSTGDALVYYNATGSAALAKIDANGNFTAISKSFDIEHPTKENMRLRYASLEGPENGVYVRGTTTTNIIELPDYWTGLVYEDSITVSLTSVGSAQNIYVEKIENNKVYIGGNLEKVFFTVYGERKDIDKLTVEYIDPSLPERPRS